MPIRVLVVDDSSFFRRRMGEILTSDKELEVIDYAVNGKDAVAKAISLKPDVITMDIEMPVLNGIEAVRQIMQQAPAPILMFSSLTHEGAKATLDALEAGALDFLPKKFEDIAKEQSEASELLRQRVKALSRRRVFRKAGGERPRAESTTSSTPVAPRVQSAARPAVAPKPTEAPQAEAVKPLTLQGRCRYKLLAIGTSTGGPVALQNILSQFPSDFPLPIVLVQHMPAAFTPAFAGRLNSLCKIRVKHAETGDMLKRGTAYLAPGGEQMLLDGTSNAPKLKVLKDDSPKITYKPSVDISFGSAAKIMGGDVLGVILTGMGADGKEGCRMLKAKGAKIWAQDEATSVVYGMPQAVTAAGIAEKNIPLNDVAAQILKEVGYG